MARGAPEALGLADDAAVLAARPGYDLVISKDAMVEGTHFLAGERCDIVARRLLRTNLSDLAAKGADPFGYFLMTAWPSSKGASDREAFIEGLKEDGARFGLALLGGDTVATPGPLCVSATILGWVPAGQAVLRSGARPGDSLVVIGGVGDGLLGLRAARGEIEDADGALAAHYRLPEPLLPLRRAVRTCASAAADVSDGLLADALHIAEASGCGLVVDLENTPLSSGARRWLDRQGDRAAGVATLASGGDDYALVCATRDGPTLVEAALAEGSPAAIAGVFTPKPGLEVRWKGAPIAAPPDFGWRHG